jgi:hypothetical protein
MTELLMTVGTKEQSRGSRREPVRFMVLLELEDKCILK